MEVSLFNIPCSFMKMTMVQIGGVDVLMRQRLMQVGMSMYGVS